MPDGAHAAANPTFADLALHSLIREAGPQVTVSDPAGAPGAPVTVGDVGAGEAGSGDELLARLHRAIASNPTLEMRWLGDSSGLSDATGSGRAFAFGAALKRAGFFHGNMCALLRGSPRTRERVAETGEAPASARASPEGDGMPCNHVDPPVVWAANLPVHGRRAGVPPGLLAPPREMVERGERLRRRVRATPPCARPDQESFLPHLPDILAGLFDSVSITFDLGVLRSYALRAEALGATVHIAATGRWSAADGTAEGYGLVSLAMWREDVGITAAVLMLRDLMERAGATVPTGDGA